MAAPIISIGTERIDVRVRGQDDRILYFKINRTARLSRLFNIYCERRQLDVQTVQFLYEGNRITGNQTPKHWDWRMVLNSAPLSIRREAEDSSMVTSFRAERLLSTMKQLCIP